MDNRKMNNPQIRQGNKVGKGHLRRRMVLKRNPLDRHLYLLAYQTSLEMAVKQCDRKELDLMEPDGLSPTTKFIYQYARHSNPVLPLLLPTP
jgi:hypothetical protein